MASRSPSRGRYRSASRSPPRSNASRSPPPGHRRRRFDSRSLSRSPRSRSRSVTPPPRRNGRHRSGSRNRSRDRGRDTRSPSENPLNKSTKIVVERLSKNINEDHLYEIFGQFGHIKDLDLPINRTFGTNRGTAYILYDHEADAEAAITHMHEAQVDGAVINVSIVLQRRKLSPAPPTARRGANIDPRVPFQSSRGGGPPSGPLGGGGGGGGRRRLSPSSRYGPRSDVYRPNSLSPARSAGGVPPPHLDLQRPDDEAEVEEEEAMEQVDMITMMLDAAAGVAALAASEATRGIEVGITNEGSSRSPPVA
ncbi:hypothetical protein V8C37DRAFT_414009 [Trichoderma ceciliae]